MIDFSMIQRMMGGDGQGILGQNPASNNMSLLGNPYAMGIPNQPQVSPYYQQFPYAGASPYTLMGDNSPTGLFNFQDYLSPFQAGRQAYEDRNAYNYANRQLFTPPSPQESAFDPSNLAADVIGGAFWDPTWDDFQGAR